MKKLTLESLEVTSFETTPEPAEERGTVHAHARTTFLCTDTYNEERCGYTNVFDCTLGCSHNTCPNRCILLTDPAVDCPPA